MRFWSEAVLTEDVGVEKTEGSERRLSQKKEADYI